MCFRKDAWIYALCLTNIGFLDLCYYTWSEVPFILFLSGFGLVLARILKEDHPGVKWYVLLGIMGICSFLTRYFGIYVWIVTGVYICALLWKYYKKREKTDFHKAVCLGITSAVSGILSMGYLMMNKIMNGMASGVSRTMWWDDFQTLTDDLIQSLLTEFFNIFSLQIPEYMENFPYRIKVFAVHFHRHSADDSDYEEVQAFFIAVSNDYHGGNLLYGVHCHSLCIVHGHLLFPIF